MLYEVWKVKKGVLDYKVMEFEDYNIAWSWILRQKDSGSYVLKYSYLPY